MERDYIVLQARLHSTRLPGKLLLPLKGGSMFEHILRRLLAASLPRGVIVATTADTVPHIRDTALRYGAHILTGSEQDVLSRFALAVRRYRIGNVVRATGDNPLVSIEYIDRTLQLHKKARADLTTFSSLPCGAGVEVIKGSLFPAISGQATDPSEREHVTRHIYRNKNKYKVVRGTPRLVDRRPDIRVTVDTPRDYTRVAKIYQRFFRAEPIKLREVISSWEAILDSELR